MHNGCTRTETDRKFLDFKVSEEPGRLIWQQSKLHGNSTCVIRLQSAEEFGRYANAWRICAKIEKLELEKSALYITISSHTKLDRSQTPWTGKKLKVCHYSIEIEFKSITSLKLIWTKKNVLESRHIFSIDPISKQSICYMYDMVDFICLGLPELWGTQAGIAKWKLLDHSGIRTASAYEASTLTVVLQDLIVSISYKWPHFTFATFKYTT